MSTYTYEDLMKNDPYLNSILRIQELFSIKVNKRFVSVYLPVNGYCQSGYFQGIDFDGNVYLSQSADGPVQIIIPEFTAIIPEGVYDLSEEYPVVECEHCSPLCKKLRKALNVNGTTVYFPNGFRITGKIIAVDAYGKYFVFSTRAYGGDEQHILISKFSTIEGSFG